MKKLFFGLAFLITLPLCAQDTIPTITVDGNVTLLSRYIFRGIDIGNGPNIQPSVSATWKGLTLCTVGDYNLSGSGDDEVDIFLTKSIGFVTIAVWDYWSINHLWGDECADKLNYFNVRNRTTGHLLEAQVLFSGGKFLPLNLLTSYNFYGADTTRSAYLELQYVPKLKIIDLVVFAGYQAHGSYYSTNGNLVNVGCTFKKSVKITDKYSIPLSLSVITNPADKKMWVVGGIVF